ncbi:MAG: leucine-rich repeat protein [Clostridia bacterium]|nr:leucine-rich repeat protein [Clostridia bacterium]
MMKLTKWIGVLAGLAAGTVMITGAAAETVPETLSLLYKGDLVPVFFDADRQEAFTEPQAIVYDALADAVNSGAERVSVADAAYTDVAELHAFVQETLNVEVYWPHVEREVQYSTDDQTGVVTELLLTYSADDRYSFSGETSAAAGITTIEQGVAHAMAAIRDDMTDLEKVLAIHDYLVREVDYDPGYPDNINEDSYWLEGVFLNRIAVCNGYALAYSHLLSQCGIDSYVVSSDPMNHAWNLIELDGTWYHADATWDDPSNQCGGFVYHKYFLKSDAEFENELGHYSWVIQNSGGTAAPEATVSDSFAGYAFRETADDVRPGMLNELDGTYYYLSNVWGSNTMYVSDISRTEVQQITLPVTVEFLFLYDGKLYGNTASRVYEMDLAGNILRTVAASPEQIVNFWLKLDTLSYCVQHGDGTQSVLDVDLVNGATNLITENGLTYIINGGKATLVEADETIIDLTVPAAVSGYPVTAIGASALEGNRNLVTVFLPDGLETIGNRAFMQTGLRRVGIPASVTYIGDMAFWNNYSMTMMTIEGNLDYLGNEAFKYCYRLANVWFDGNAPRTVGTNVFTECDADFTIYYNVGTTGWSTPTWSPNANESYNAVMLTPVGDLTGNGTVDQEDVSMISDWFAGKYAEVPFETYKADFNGDGKFSRADGMYLARALAGWEGYTLS